MLSSLDMTRKRAAAFASKPSLPRAQSSSVPPVLVLTLKGKWSSWSRAQVRKARPIIFNWLTHRTLASSGTLDSRAGRPSWPKPDIQLPYLKLHGSLNWDRNVSSEPVDGYENPVVPAGHPTQAVEHPLILPPVFNKTDSPKINSVWKAALTILRKAKNIVIVGYSLPKTDIYMQYFLKSAVGPNSNLQKIIVFDPVLFRGDEKTAQMKPRYKECFSPQFSGRIIFEPALDVYQSKNSPWGTFQHFTEALRTRPKYLLFYP